MTIYRIVILGLLLSGCGVRENADLLLVNGRIFTMDETRPEVEAVAIRSGKIIDLGTSAAIKKKYVGTKLEDLHGAMAMPAFTDAHAHVFGLGHMLMELDVTGTDSYEEIIDKTEKRVGERPKGSWIRGRGWDQNDWQKKEFPNHMALSEKTPDHFVFLERVDGHAILVNANVMKESGITATTKDPDGGKIIRDEKGVPTGVLVDNAMNLVIPPAYTRQEDSLALQLAMAECLKFGIAEVHDPGVRGWELDLYKSFGEKGLLKIRIYAMLDGFKKDLLETNFKKGVQRGLYNEFLTIASVKLYSDGALGSRGAALLAPYSDDPKNSGLEITTEKEIERITEEALRAGFQVNTHAIGDRGNRNTLDAYETALLKTRHYGKDTRLRIEHAQVVALTDIPRFKKLGVIASMQPTHCTSDMYWAETRVGSERIRGAYAWQTFLKNGVVIANGSDAPVESINPLLGIYAAVTRQDQKAFPEGGWYPAEKMNMMEALRGFTIQAAYAGFEEKTRGSLELGKWADITVLSKNLFDATPLEILNTKVKMTVVGGKILYRAHEN